jgi:hypothetical protein
MKSSIGEISQLPSNHLKGFLPRKSTGETIIENILISKNIEYIKEKTFDNCKNIKKLRFDFYIPSINLCIEYNGIQHYEIVNRFGGKEKLLYQRNNDLIKSSFCKENNINLIVISYKDCISSFIDEITNYYHN